MPNEISKLRRALVIAHSMGTGRESDHDELSAEAIDDALHQGAFERNLTTD